uniref:hypothetical protein n=1 Tax=Nocardia asiatica TaxID=209252 RepID=UPI0024555282
GWAVSSTIASGHGVAVGAQAGARAGGGGGAPRGPPPGRAGPPRGGGPAPPPRARGPGGPPTATPWPEAIVLDTAQPIEGSIRTALDAWRGAVVPAAAAVRRG